MSIIIATRSEIKIAEAKAIFGPNIKTLKDFEAFPEIHEIQHQEHEAIFRHKCEATIDALMATGELATDDQIVIEDTGLEIEFLGGAPGPYIKYFGFEAIKKIVEAAGRTKAWEQCHFALYEYRRGEIFRMIESESNKQGMLYIDNPLDLKPHLHYDSFFHSITADDYVSLNSYAKMGQRKKLEVSARGKAFRFLLSHISSQQRLDAQAK